MKVYQILNQLFYTDVKGIERACGTCFEEGLTFSSKAKAERALKEILEENNLNWVDVQLFPKTHIEIKTYPDYNCGRLSRKVYWLNEIEVL